MGAAWCDGLTVDHNLAIYTARGILGDHVQQTLYTDQVRQEVYEGLHLVTDRLQVQLGQTQNE